MQRVVRTSLVLLGLASATVIAGCRRGNDGEPGRPLTERAARAVELAEKARDPSDPPGQAGQATGSAEPPSGYVVMKAKAQLDPSRGNALLLVDDAEQIVVPIFVGNTEALSIRLRLDSEKYKRPLTHDLLDELLRLLGGTMLRAQVDELRDNVYIGTVVVRDRDGGIHEVDARPSDAIALAIGNRAPIFMAQKVIDLAGHRIEDLGKVGKEPEAARPSDMPL